MSILTKLLLHDVPRGRGNKTGISFGRPAPYNLGWRKKVQNSAQFLTTFDFDREYLRNGSTYRTSEKKLINHNPFHVGRKLFDELWSTNRKVLVTLVGIFLETTFRPLGGAAPWKFFNALEIDQGYLAHSPTWTGSPKNFNRENLTFGLKFSVWASITSGLVGISSPKFSRRRGELWSTYKKVVPYKRKHWSTLSARSL